MNKSMKLIYPAVKWEDALPCGNGEIGALVFGNIRNELIVINHDRLYLKKNQRPNFKDVHQYLPQARKIMMDGNYSDGYNFLMNKFEEGIDHPGGTNPYQPFCDIHIVTDTHHAFKNYSRKLDFETGEATVSWTEDDLNNKRQLFVSRKNHMIVLKMSFAKPYSKVRIGLSAHGVLGAMGLGSGKEVPGKQIDFDWSSEVSGKNLVFKAIMEDGTSMGAVGQIITDGEYSTITIDGMNFISIDSSHEIIFTLKLFLNEDAVIASDRLKRVLGLLIQPYEEMLDEHAAIHGELFNRMNLNLVCDEHEDNYNEQLLLTGYNGDVSTELLQKMADFGRYLLISSTAPDSMPPNLQGIWNGDYNPAWACDFHNDINIQMAYWPALAGNLPETMLPLFNYYESLLEDFRKNALNLYGCRGILLPISHTTHGLMNRKCPWNGWTGGAAWISQHYYDYWLYTGDEEFLRNRALPFMEETAMFYLDFFIEDKQGNLLSIPSLSPENRPKGMKEHEYVVSNATMDFALAKEVLTNLLSAYKQLDLDDQKGSFEKLLNKIPDYKINEDGAIREWMTDGLKDNYHHRHMSHIYPFFPGIEVTAEKNEEIYNAMKIAVEKRLVIGLTAHANWSLNYLASIYARLGDGDKSLECLELLCRSCTGNNLFTYSNDWRSQGITMFWGHDGRPPFQIDANFGLTAAVLDMLLFSDNDLIKVLPAVPRKWKKGSVQNMLCRGRISISIIWNLDKKEIIVKLRMDQPKSITLKFPESVKSHQFLSGSVEIETSPYGESYQLFHSETSEFTVKILLY
jgi:alpha-L-fucosidase 2